MVRTVLLWSVILAAPVYAQPQRDVFKVDFTIRDSGDAGGKTGRKYSMVVYSAQKGVFKIGNRVPTPTNNSGGFNYVDVGVNIDCVVQEAAGGRMAIRADLDLSTAVTTDKTVTMAPTISQIKVGMEAAIAPGKPTVIAAFDDPVTTRKFEVEALVTKLN
jgi:hypothetical protein